MTDKNQDKQPVERLRDGPVELAIWRRETENGAVFNTERTRSYQDKDGNWHKTHSMPEHDLLRAARLDQKAYESIQQMRDLDRERYVKQKAASQTSKSRSRHQ